MVAPPNGNTDVPAPSNGDAATVAPPNDDTDVPTDTPNGDAAGAKEGRTID